MRGIRRYTEMFKSDIEKVLNFTRTNKHISSFKIFRMNYVGAYHNFPFKCFVTAYPLLYQ